MKRDRHWLALYFSSGDISFVALTPPSGRDKDLVDKRMSIPVGTLEDCNNKDEETTTMSNYIF